jgi:acyl-homoserine-lactone acylase
MRHLLTLIVFVSLSIGNFNGKGGNEAPSADALAGAVTIYRDTYGTPHVFGKSDASTVFGLAYAQVEDNFAQVEEDFALGEVRTGTSKAAHRPSVLTSRLNLRR